MDHCQPPTAQSYQPGKICSCYRAKQSHLLWDSMEWIIHVNLCNSCWDLLSPQISQYTLTYNLHGSFWLFEKNIDLGCDCMPVVPLLWCYLWKDHQEWQVLNNFTYSQSKTLISVISMIKDDVTGGKIVVSLALTHESKNHLLSVSVIWPVLEGLNFCINTLTIAAP